METQTNFILLCWPLSHEKLMPIKDLLSMFKSKCLVNSKPLCLLKDERIRENSMDAKIERLNPWVLRENFLS